MPVSEFIPESVGLDLFDDNIYYEKSYFPADSS